MLSRPHWDRDAGEWPHRQASRFVSAGGVRWHVMVMGRGPAVVLLHPPAGASHTWATVAPLLAGSLTVIAPDLPNHGFSSADAGEGPVEQLLTLLDAIAAQPAIVIGHSAGFGDAVALASRLEPGPAAVIGVAAAAGIPSTMPLGTLRPLIERALAEEAGRGLSGRFVARFLAALARRPGLLERFLASSGSTLPAESIDRYRSLLAHAGQVAAGVAAAARIEGAAVLEAVYALASPLLLIAGERDGWVPDADSAHLAGTARRGLLVRIDGAGHFPHEDQPETVARYVLELAGGLGLIR